MKKFILLILVVFSFVRISYACDEGALNFKADSVAIWLGQNSPFSKTYRDGKCMLDKVLVDIPIEQRKVIANLIAKSYDAEIKKSKEIITYNY